MSVTPLATGAELRLTGPCDGTVVLCIDGGTAREVPGTWSASVEYLVRRLAPDLPELGWAEVRYRVRSWNRLEMCIEDAATALDAVGALGPREVVLLGYSMGGAVAAAIAGDPRVRRVVALAPWLPEQLDATGMRGREISVIHGSLDRPLPGIPGVSPRSSREGLERLRRSGASGSYELLRGGMHAIALRAPWGAAVPMPRAAEWARRVRGAIGGGGGPPGLSRPATGSGAAPGRDARAARATDP